jgi:hypothetical protein
VALTRAGRQAPLHRELCATDPPSRKARTARGEVPSECPQGESAPPSGAASDTSTAGAVAGPHGCRVSDTPGDQSEPGRAHVPPWWHAGTERPIHRPTAPEAPQEHSRGQKKCHTVNNRRVLHATCHRGCLRAPSAGKGQEKSVADLEGSPLPQGSGLYQEMGFQGFLRNALTIVHPKKHPRGGARPPPETATHRRLSSISIRSEHAMGGVTRDRRVKDTRRRFTDGMRDTRRDTCCGLQTFRLQYRPWHYASS